MGRKQTIDREMVLEVAERLVAAQGAAALTIASVASAAGISKGGVQSCFSTRQELIGAMLDRWFRSYAERTEHLVGAHPSPQQRRYAHAEVTLSGQVDGNERAASLLAAMDRMPEHLRATREWYAELAFGLEGSGPERSLERLAFFAVEGAFFLRYLGLMDLSDAKLLELRRDVMDIFGT